MEEIRPLEAAELEAAWELDREAFRTPLERRELFLRHDPAQVLGAFVGARLVGIAGVWRMGQYFGGRVVPMGGVHAVAVAADRRGRGLGKRLLAALLAAMREQGLALSTLFPATSRPYRPSASSAPARCAGAASRRASSSCCRAEGASSSRP